MRTFLERHPVARELLADAEVIDGDTHWRRNLAYCSERFAGDGFALVGDASAFLDPFYSPGMDWISFTVARTVALIAAERRGEAVADRVEAHNRDFAVSYERWFSALYKDKYEYIGEFDLVSVAFRLDLGLYYLGVVSLPFQQGARGLLPPPFSEPRSRAAFEVMNAYNRRLAAMARVRRERGRLGRRNHGERFLVNGYTLNPGDIRLLLRPVLDWLRLELTEGWRSWGRRSPRPAATDPIPLIAAKQSS
jgi:hypothetical protein